MNKHQFRLFFSILMLSTLSFSAHAHTGLTQTGMMLIHSFSHGFFHPWMGIDHLLVMLAVGIWAAVSGGRSLWLLPVAFLTTMAAGALLKFSGFMLNGAEIWVAFSVLALGLILSINQRMSALITTCLVAAFALGHGYVHAAEITSDSNAATYALGFLAATATLHAAGLTAGLFGPQLLKTMQTSFGWLCMLAGAALLAGV